ncbi:calcium uniporter protein 3, mitochondrial-like [Canna indica]|uniref:Calcium uniporter protein 3, mitochondrial-like n=1 Tax=Canna indica TaxID=4628 RepID=A0AAQ3KCA9_9LILI|nr:calcium uniporter protein 3, mitochondrial-like [Canna indica]
MAALRKTLARRFASLLRPSAVGAPTGRTPLLRRFPLLQKRPFFQPALPPDRLAMPFGADVLAERIRSLSPGRICLDGILPPPPNVEPAGIEGPPPPNVEPAGIEGEEEDKEVKLEAVRKVVRASQVAAARAKLGATGKSVVAYPEFVRICCEASNAEQGMEIARSLDQSGVVIVLGNVVFLKPEEVVQTIENMIPMSLSHENDPSREELMKMEEKKAEIDREAAAQVRKELWCGLGFMVAQTAALMRVTFWELSWDVMEPICFYLTSIYFMAGYGFFLKTSKEPSFESFFVSRFATKQRQLMKAYNFDLSRFNELQQASQRRPPQPPLHPSFTFVSYRHCDRKNPSFIGSSE